MVVSPVMHAWVQNQPDGHVDKCCISGEYTLRMWNSFKYNFIIQHTLV